MNYFLSLKSWRYVPACTILLISGITAAQAQVPAGPSHPPSVPEEYVATPMGYFHPSCVQALAEGDTVRKDEKAIEHKDGSFDAIPACAFPRYTPSGEKVSLDGAGPAGEEKAASDGEGREPGWIGHEYIELATMQKHPANTYYGELRANWIVPPDPTSHDGQIVYLFPGLEDYTHVDTILQPVLGWNARAQSSVPNAWSIASWNCCVNGTVQHSPGMLTAAGHEIFGVMVCTTPGASLCGSFNVTTVDTTSSPNKSTELKETSSFGQTFNWAYAGALEVYNISKCSDYPSGSDGSTEFYYLGLYDDELHPLTQGWVDAYDYKTHGVTLVCNYKISGGFKDGLHEITLKY